MHFLFGSFLLDAERQELVSGERTVPIRKLPLRLLLHLVRNRDRVVSKDELFGELWPETVVSDAALSSALRDVRRALASGGGSTSWIATSRGRGLRFVAEVSEVVAARSAAVSVDGAVPGVAAKSPVDGEPPFVGRTVTRTLLRRSLAGAQSGAGRLVLLAGEAGIGKTRMMQEFAREAEARGVEVLTGRCLESEGAPPLRPWVQVVRGLVRRRSPASLRAELGGGALELARVVPEIREVLPDLPPPPRLEPRLAHFRLIDAATEFLLRGRRPHPRLLLLDDLHKADLSSLELLDHLAREIVESHVLVIGAYRDTEVEPGSGLAELLGRIARFSESRLLPRLTVAEVRRYCGLALEEAPSPERVRELRDLSGGNPFLLNLLVTARWETSDRMLPRGAREAVLRQAELLGPGARALLRTASVFGREFRAAAVADVAGLDSRAALDCLEEAVDARLVEPAEEPGAYRFAHAIVAEVLYGTVAASDRLDLHGRAGLALERLLGVRGGHEAELAHHFSEATLAGYAERALAACARAAERAAEQLAFDEAAEHRELALSVFERTGGTDEDRLEVRLQAADAWSRTWQIERAREHYASALELALQLGDVDAIGRASLGACLGEEATGAPQPQWIGILERAARVVTEPGPLRVRVLGRLGYALWFAEPRERARDVLGEAIELGRRVGDADALASVLGRAYYVYWAPGLREQRLAISDELDRLADHLQDRSLRVDAHVARLWDALGSGDRETFDRRSGALEGDARELRQPLIRWYASVFRSSAVGFLEGRFAEAFREFNEGERLAEAAHSPLHTGGVLIQRTNLLADWGRPAEAIPMVERILSIFPVPLALVHLMLLRAMCGEREEARAHLEAMGREGFPVLTPDLNFYNGAFLLAELCRELEASREAGLLYEKLLPCADEHIVGTSGWVYRGSIERYLGLLAGLGGDVERAVGHFERGIERERLMRARPSLACGLRDFGAMLWRNGDRRRARECLQESHEIASELGMELVREQAADLLHS